MDIGELMKFKPPTAPKRPAPAPDREEEEDVEDDPNESYESRAAKRRRRQRQEARRREAERLAALEAEAAEVASGASASDDGLTEEQRRHIRSLLDRDDGAPDSTLDEGALKKLILNFEKRALKNRELRVKFPDDPQKFMESEVELHDAIQDLRVLATAPDLYPTLVSLGCVPSFLGLLSHENTDLSVAVVDLLQELTDVDQLNESEEGADALVDALVKEQVSPLLVQNLERMNDAVREESDGIHNTLAIFENLLEFRPELCKEAAEANLLQWLIKRLKVKVPFDNNKLYASEILSILLQSDPDNRKKVGETASAIDSLLQQLAYYKRHNPGTPEESELMENLFDCLCSLMLHKPNRERFLRGEGLQLMNLMLREKKLSRNGALKVLDHALTGPEGRDNCNKFVDILGLRTIFPLFMKTPKKSKRKGVSMEEHEEHVIAIVASLMKNCRGGQKQRLVAKFTEADHEKVDRIMELHFKYLDKVQAADRRADDERRRNGQEEEDEDEDEAYLRRLDSGLFTLQLVDFIVAEASAAGASTVKQRILKILNQRNGSVMDIRDVLREYAGNLGDSASQTDKRDDDEGVENGGEAAKEQEKQYILSLVDKF